MEKSKNRILWVDAARGIAMLLVILGHCIGSLNDPGYKFILSFHMPLFFFLSGYCSKKEEQFRPYLKKKARELLVPQLLFGVFECWIDMMSGRPEEIDILNDFLGWFLLVLFYISIVFWLIQTFGYEKKRTIRFGVFIINFILIIILERLQVSTLLHIEVVPMALLFFLLGYQCRRSDFFESDIYQVISSVCILLIPVLAICSSCNAPVTMYTNNYGNYPLFFIGALGGIFFICEIGKRIQDNQIIIWIGENTIYFFVLHFAAIKGLHFIGKLVFSKASFSNYSYPIYWMYFIVCILVLLPGAWICNRWFSPLFGKNKERGKQKGENRGNG